MPLGAEALGRILDHCHASAGGDGIDRFMVGALPEQRHRDDRGCARRHGSLERGDIEEVGAWIDVYEDRRRPDQRDRLGRGDVGKRGRDHLPPRPDAKREQGDRERVGAVAAGDAVGPARLYSQPQFQFAHFRAVDVATVGEHPREPGLQIRLDPPPLGRQIDELDHDSSLIAPPSRR